MTDLSQFAAEGFDPREWINEACTTVPEGDTLERCILQMRYNNQNCPSCRASTQLRRVWGLLCDLSYSDHTLTACSLLSCGEGQLHWHHHNVTSQCKSPLCFRHLAGLEMRLALAAEDVEAGLADASDRALRRIPAASAEVNVLQVCGTVPHSAM